MDFIENNRDSLERRLKELGLSIGDCAVTKGQTPNHVSVTPPDGRRIILQRVKIEGEVDFKLIYRRWR